MGLRPMREPWRNGAVEKFNDHWGAKFQRRVDMTTAADLARESLAFETRQHAEDAIRLLAEIGYKARLREE